MDEFEKYLPSIDTSDPNTRYDSDHTIVYELSNTSMTTMFCNTYTHDNNYSGLKLGQCIKINDDVYDKYWYIAGFDVESNKIASDGTTYDNGYGIMLIPETYLVSTQWNTRDNNTSYISSSVHTGKLIDVSNDLKTVLGTHLVNRNVLLSSSATSGISTAYTWTTAYCTLPSIGQLTGTFASHNNKYDDGEANYKLPLFNYMSISIGDSYFTRCLYGIDSDIYRIWAISSDGSISYMSKISSRYIRPLIYIR